MKVGIRSSVAARAVRFGVAGEGESSEEAAKPTQPMPMRRVPRATLVGRLPSTPNTYDEDAS